MSKKNKAAAGEAGAAKPLAKPNKDLFDKRIKEKIEEINKKKDAVEKITASISEKKDGKGELDEVRAELFQQLGEIKVRREALIAEKTKILAAKKDAREKEFQAKQELKNLSSAAESLNEEELDKNIASLEYKMQVRTKPLTLKEEKSIMMEIKKLKSLKPKAAKLSRDLEAKKAQGQGQEGVAANPGLSQAEQLEELNAKLDEIKKERDAVSEKLDGQKTQMDLRKLDLEPIVQKRSKLRDEITKLIEEKKEIMKERDDAWAAWKAEQDKIWEEKKAQREAEKAELNKQWAKEELERKLEQPSAESEKVVLIKATIDYCKDQLPASSKKDDSEGKELEHVNPEGYMVMKSKKQREEEESYLTGVKGKKGKRGLKASEPVSEDKKSLSTKQIKHTADSLGVFKQLGVSTPMTISDLPGVITELEVKLTEAEKAAETYIEDLKKEAERMAAEGYVIVEKEEAAAEEKKEASEKKEES